MAWCNVPMVILWITFTPSKKESSAFMYGCDACWKALKLWAVRYILEQTWECFGQVLTTIQVHSSCTSRGTSFMLLDKLLHVIAATGQYLHRRYLFDVSLWTMLIQFLQISQLSWRHTGSSFGDS